MKSTLHYLTQLRASGIRLAVEAGELRIHAPKGAVDAEMLAELKSRKNQIVTFLTDQQLSGPIPVPRTAEGEPLSPFQRSLWATWRLNAMGYAYNIPLAFALDSEIEPTRLIRCLEHLYRRHEILRSRFFEINGTPHQRVDDQPLDVRVVASTPIDVQDELAAAAAQIFDLENGPLFHARIFDVGSGEWILLLNMHHIVADGWSMRVFMEELGTLYAHAADPTCLPAPTVQYIDYCHWQRRQAASARYAESLDYWRRTLADAPAFLDMPTDRPRPALPSMLGDIVKTVLDQSISSRLREFARQRACSLHQLMLASYQLLLSRYSGQDDLIVGAPHANRGVVEIANTVGYFVNPLAIRTRIDREAGFSDLLAVVRANFLSAIEHGEIPFSELVNDLQVDRSARYSPIFQALYSFQSDEDAHRSIAGFSCRPLALRNASAKFDLSLVVSDGAQLGLSFEYSADLFDPATIEQMASNFVTLLHGLVAEPDRAIGTLPLVDARERERLLHEFNPAPRAYAHDASIASAFAEQTTKHAGRTAVIHGDVALSYRELDACSDRVANRLRKAGIQPGQFVGLAIERSHLLLVGMLGIVKAGAAYVPLDVSLPRERLAQMCASTNLHCCLIRGASAPVLSSLMLQCLDVEAHPANDDVAPPPVSMIDAAAPAYVNFSSGTTGQPKGIVCTQRGVVRLVKNQNYLDFSEETRFVHAAPISFDAATLEIWAPLLNGGTCVVYSQEMLTCSGIARCISDHGANAMWVTSALFNALTDTDPTCFHGLTNLLVGGDVVSPHHVRKAYRANVDVSIINGYGPTENTTFTCCHRIACDLPATEYSVPIGRPIAHGRVYVLDAYGQLLPQGAIGELCVAGDGLALGYLGDATLSGEAFVPDPFVDGEGWQDTPARMYRTGDLVRYRRDGTLEFVGRKDSQVKVNGYRIELAEVEAVMRDVAAVIDCAVLVESVPNASKRLVAFVVIAADFSLSALQAHLRERLPHYMVPSLVCAVDAIPITRNGKLDRDRLLAMDLLRLTAAGEEYAEPRTEIERALTSLWSSLLGHDRIGIHDDFFTLGGHSIVAAQLAAKASQEFHVEVSLRDFFQHSTIARLAGHIESLVSALGIASEVPASIEQADDPQGWVPLSPGQMRLWQEYESYPEVGRRNNIAVALKLHGAVIADALERAINAVIARHQPLRARMVVSGDRAGQQFDCDAPLALQRRRVHGMEAALPINALIQGEYEQPFDLEAGPLVRVVLLEYAPTENLLIVLLNHLAFDGWSTGVLVRELAALYSAEVRGQGATLPDLPLSYGHYAQDRSRRLTSPQHAQAVDYWRQTLHALPERLELPGDKPRPPVFTGRGDVTGMRLPNPLRENMLTFCREQGLTPYMVLLAAYLWVLGEQTPQSDLFVRSSVADRSLPGSENLIGYFMSLIVVRENIGKEDAFDAFMLRIKSRVLDALAHDVSPDVLSQAAGSKPDAGYYSKFQLIHIHHSFPKASQVEFAGLIAEQLKPALKIKARFDLCLHTSVGPEYIDVGFVYYADLFSPAAMARIAERYCEFLTLRFDPTYTGSLKFLTSRVESAVEGVAQ